MSSYVNISTGNTITCLKKNYDLYDTPNQNPHNLSCHVWETSYSSFVLLASVFFFLLWNHSKCLKFSARKRCWSNISQGESRSNTFKRWLLVNINNFLQHIWVQRFSVWELQSIRGSSQNSLPEVDEVLICVINTSAVSLYFLRLLRLGQKFRDQMDSVF